MVVYHIVWTFMVSLVTVTAVRRHLTEIECARVIQMLADGVFQRDVAQAFGVSQSVVSRVNQRFQDDGLYGRRPGAGQPRVTTPRQDRYLGLMTVVHRSGLLVVSSGSQGSV